MSDRQQDTFKFWLQQAELAAAKPDPLLPPLKKFTPKFTLPAVTNYRTTANATFWNSFPENKIITGVSPISATRLRSWSNAVGCSDKERFEKVCKNIENGANIGCKGRFRDPSTSTNAPSAYQFGAEVTDAIAGWVDQKIAAGPFDPKLRPKNAKVSGIMCRIKPNGTARVILNLSAPVGNAVNEGIDGDLFPAVMSSTSKWLEILDKAGRNCLIMKVDWANAYKHIPVRTEDLPLQYFNWMGKDFVELMLIFGAVSSAGLFDDLAKVVLDLVARQAHFPRDTSCSSLPPHMCWIHGQQIHNG